MAAPSGFLTRREAAKKRIGGMLRLEGQSPV
jgi:hypothetical protein